MDTYIAIMSVSSLLHDIPSNQTSLEFSLRVNKEAGRAQCLYGIILPHNTTEGSRRRRSVKAVKAQKKVVNRHI